MLPIGYNKEKQMYELEIYRDQSGTGKLHEDEQLALVKLFAETKQNSTSIDNQEVNSLRAISLSNYPCFSRKIYIILIIEGIAKPKTF
jgi:hypothetical protein